MPDEILSILGLVRHHHDPKKLVLRSAGRNRYARLARAVNHRMLYLLEQCDLRGRTCSDLESQLEILELFRREMYGRSPGKPEGMTFKVLESDDNALGGKARRKQVSVNFTGKPGGLSMDILIYLPKDAKGPVPTFVGMNFRGNHTTTLDEKVRLARGSKHKRGAAASRWPMEEKSLSKPFTR